MDCESPPLAGLEQARCFPRLLDWRRGGLERGRKE